MYPSGLKLKPDKHKKYLKRCLHLLPTTCQNLDSTR